MEGGFWDTANLATCYGEKIALIEARAGKSISITYSQLEQMVSKARSELLKHTENANEKQLIMIVANNSIESIVYYLAALQLKHVVWWVNKDDVGKKLVSLQKRYLVNLFIDNGQITRLNLQLLALHQDLALLITTSGSTGSPTLVRLSYQNLDSNCKAICQALSLQSTDMTVTTLPLHYSFGLSILNTHLNVASTILLTEDTLMTRDFWSLFKSYDIKCLYGVPYIFDMLLKLALVRIPLKSLRLMAVAGGKLTADKVTVVNNYCLANNIQFYVMYGQTEATARISVLPSEKVVNKPFSIGQSISGKLWIENVQGQILEGEQQSGELCYQGDNVMMGLAKTVNDLNLSTTSNILRTGDLATRDKAGDYQIVGRLKRIIKVVGHRINLDEIEHYFSTKDTQLVCSGYDDMIYCYFKSNEKTTDDLQQYCQLISDYLSIHTSYCQCFAVKEFPYLASGKLDYKQLEELCGLGENA